MNKCWANSQKNCSNKLSGEHILSESIFINQSISVKGFQWCKEDYKKVGLANLTINALCEYHNSSLSPLDNEARILAESLREFEKINAIRNPKNPRNPSVKEYQINGNLIERWFLKTLINVSTLGKLPIGEESNGAGKPSSRLVSIVFGKEQFKEHEGLYILKNQKHIIRGGEVYKISGVFDGDKCVIGGIFDFRGFHFFLSLKNVHIFDFLMHKEIKNDPLAGSVPIKHLKNLKALTKGETLSQRIRFEW